MNVMKKAKRWLLSVVFVLMSLCLAMGFVSMGRWTVKADAGDVTMKAGGSFRYEEPLGLGFLTQIDRTYYDTQAETNDVKTGTLFVRKADVVDAEGKQVTLTNDNFTIEGLGELNTALADDKKFIYKDVENDGWKNVTETHYEFRGSVVNMHQVNVEKEYCARGYLAYRAKDAAETDPWTYEYTPYVEADHCRSIENIAIAAMADTGAYDEKEYPYEVSEGVYSPYDETARASISKYLPRENEKEIFDVSENDMQYLYYADGNKVVDYTKYTATTATSAVIKDKSYLEMDAGLALNGYTGSAVEISNFARNNQTFVKLPSRYATENAGKYSKIGVWFAMSRTSDATWDKDIYLNPASYVTNNKTLKMGTAFEYNTFYYVELDLPTVDNACWAYGYLRLWDIWSDANATLTDSAFKAQHKLYLGNVTYMTAEEIAERDNEKKAEILNGLTKDNYTQYKLEGRNDGEDRVFVSSEDLAKTTLQGGYTGSAVQFRPSNNNPMTVDFPADASYFTKENSEATYLTVWVALKTHTDDYKITGQLTFDTNYLYNKNSVSYARSNKNFMTGTTHVRWDTTESASFKIDTWYQLYVPLTTVTSETGTHLDGTIDMFKLLYDNAFGTDQNNFRILVGDIGLATQAEMETNRNQEKAEILTTGVTKDNYTQYKRGGGTDQISFKSVEDLASEYALSGEYTGNAVASVSPNNGNKYTLDIAKDSLPASGNLYVWVAVVVTNSEYTPSDQDRLRAWSGTDGTFGANFSNGVKNTGDLAFNTWHKITRSADKVVMNENGCLMLSLGIGDSWTASNYTILIGNFGIEPIA